MKLLSLQTRNFKKLRPDAPIAFGDGLTIIEGLNESGKSSLLDAILYALFGRVIRPTKARIEDILSYGTNEGSLTLEFEIGEKRFRVNRRIHRTRTTKATLEEIRDNTQLALLANGPEKVNEEIVNLLGGITYQEIISSTVVAQKELDKLIELHKDDRRKIINIFLNLDSFNNSLSTLSEERKEIEGTANRPGALTTQNERLEKLSEELNQFNLNTAEKAHLGLENADLEKQFAVLKASHSEKEALYKLLWEYDRVASSRDVASAQLKSKRQLYDDYQARRVRLENEAAGIKRNLNELDSYMKSQPIIQKIHSQSESLKSQSIAVAAEERRVQTTRQEIKDLEQKTQRYTKRTPSTHRRTAPYLTLAAATYLSSLVAFLIGAFYVGLGLIVAGFLPLFLLALKLRGTSLNSEQQALVDIRYLDEKRRELSHIEERMSGMRLELEQSQNELTTLCSTLSSSPNPKIEPLEAAREVIEIAAKNHERVQKLEARAQAVEKETAQLPSEGVLSELADEVATYEKQLNQLILPVLPTGMRYDQNLLSSIQVELEELTRELTTTETTRKHNGQRLAELSKFLGEHQDISVRVQAQEQIVSKLERQLVVLKRAVDGVQSTSESLRNRIRPTVQAHLASILPALTSSRYKAAILDDEYNLRVWDPEAGEYKPRDVYSGGTEDQMLLALRLSFALALLPEVKGQKPEFVFLDEPLGSSDEIRQSDIVEFMATELAKKFKQIFVISHVRGLEEYADHVVRLEDGRPIELA